ncbi:hypothetical protein EDB80DRAFT_752259 [Ilyonectria destructans]|nr:hypothetical protein EDB80DRAFT_752259 [Ilyonectria destructans]
MAAIALLESGHDVEIYEKSQFKNEVGAAIMAPPNSSRVLAFYGLDFERTLATTSENASIISLTLRITTGGTIYYDEPSDIEKKRVLPVADYVSKYKAPWQFYHRVDLHNELKQMAVEPTATRPRAARLHLNTAVSKLDQDGTIHFEDGRSVKKQLVVAADGIRSSFLSSVSGKDVPANHYMSMLRFMVPVEKLRTDPETVSLFKDGYTSLRIAYGTDKSVVFYGCRRGALQNVGVLYRPELSIDASGNDISMKEDFVNEVVKEYPEAIQSICT